MKCGYCKNIIDKPKYNQIYCCVECNDLDGDLIVGLTCYEKVTCSTIIKSFNPESCEEILNDKR